MASNPQTPPDRPLTPRQPVYGRESLLACEHPLAAAVGLDVLKSGGNAVDAALAVSAAIAVVKPSSSHIGGEAFLHVYWAQDQSLTVLNASGPAPRSTNVDSFSGSIPQTGPNVCTVPGLVAAWDEASQRWASRPLADLLQPAIHYAKDGFPVSNDLAWMTGQVAPHLARFADSARVYLPGGQAPKPGQVLVQADLARTLASIAKDGPGTFYHGDVAERIARFITQNGGFLGADDLSEYRPEFMEPIATTYRGYTVTEQPPNSQGYLVLQALNILEGFDLAEMCRTQPSQALHLMAEAMRLGLEERRLHSGDPRFVDMPIEMMLSKEHAAKQRQDIGDGRPTVVETPSRGGDTTAFVVADRWGNVVSWIQSVFTFYGSCVVAGDTGVLLNNRCTGFTLEEGHPNRIAPGKRPLHTLNTYMVLKDGRPIIAGGSPGAEQQVQTNLQVLVNLLDLGMDPQRAVDAPRWGYTLNGGLKLERRFPDEVVSQLSGLRDDVTLVGPWDSSMGRANVLLRDPDTGVTAGGSDTRSEGCALGL